jgi:hypothetical protein
MRITVHSAENQQRFAIALTLTQKWLTTKTAADVVRLFVKRFDAKHGSKTTDAFGLAVRGGDAVAPDQPLGAALGSSTDLELRRVESSDDALAQLRKLETMEEAAISKAYRALARGAGEGLVRDLSRVDATTLDAALQTFLGEDGSWIIAREVYRSSAFVRALKGRMPTGLPRRAEILEPLGCTIAERSSWRRPPADAAAEGVAALILEKAPERRKPCELTPLAFWAQNALNSNDVVLTREAVDELASYMRERLELRPVGFRPVAVCVEITIEPTRPRGQRRVDGVGRPTFEFHTGRRRDGHAKTRALPGAGRGRGGRRGDARHHRSVPADASIKLLELRQCTVAHATQRHGTGP